MLKVVGTVAGKHARDGFDLQPTNAVQETKQPIARDW